MRQQTLSKCYKFEGKGLHSGKIAHMTIGPAPAGTGIVFHRVDLGPDAKVAANASNVSRTARSTTISCGKASVNTIEHLLSALTGFGVDNALVEIDSLEVPILDGSARPYVEAFGNDPLVEQDAEREWIEIKEPIEIRDPKSGSWIRIEPSESLSYEVTIDFNSKVLGVQTVSWDPTVDYGTEVGPCRTFCFLHEIMSLLLIGLVKGGDVNNAIVIVEKPVSERRLKQLARRFGQDDTLSVKDGYLSNLVLRFPDECGRHKLLDLMGDLRLCGGFFKAKITAYKPGHRINTMTALSIIEKLKNNG